MPRPATSAPRGSVQAQFGPSAAAYVTSAGHAAGDDLDTLLAWARRLGPERALDLATGGGHTALGLAALAPEVVALDVTEPMLAAARAFLRGRGAERVSFVGGDVTTLPFRQAAFDLVTCRIAAHHFPDVGAAVREAARVLRPGGELIVQDILGHDDPRAAAFITEVERRRDPSHVRSLTAAEWTDVLERAAFRVRDRAVFAKVRIWDDWTGRMRLSEETRGDLEAYVREAPEALRAAFAFEVDDGRVRAFTDRMLLLSAVSTASSRAEGP